LGVSAAIVAGPDSGLIDLSRGGALLEVPARLSLGSAVRLKLAQPGRELIVVNGRVAWQKVASIAGGQIYYRVAIAFEQPLAELPGADALPQEQPQRSLSIVPARDNLTPFPAPAAQSTNASAEAADAATQELRRQLEAATADLACQTAVLESVAAKLKESEQQRATHAQQAADAARKTDALHAALEARERKHAESLRDQEDRYEALSAKLAEATNERQADYQRLLQQATEAEQQCATLAQQAADAAKDVETLHAELEAREQTHAQSLREQKERYEANIAALIKATNEQQAEYQTLSQQAMEAEQQHAALAQRATEATNEVEALHADLEAREQTYDQSLRDQKDRYESIIAELVNATNEQQAEYQTLLQQTIDEQNRQHDEEQKAERAQADARYREIEARLGAAEALCADQQERFRALRKETEKLLLMVDAASTCGEVDQSARAAS
jgi:hypothetical protein